MPEQAEYVDDARVTHRDASKIERVVHANIIPSPTLEPGTTFITNYAIVVIADSYRPKESRSKTLAERINEAYRDELEPKEKELLDRAAEQFGRRLRNEG